MIFFASDVHLSSDTPAITARFLSFLERARREAQSVYLLGDIFESWVGDEDLGLKAYQPVFHALKETVQAGVAVYFMAGNRDFMVSDHVLAELGLTQSPDKQWHGKKSDGGRHYCRNKVSTYFSNLITQYLADTLSFSKVCLQHSQ